VHSGLSILRLICAFRELSNKEYNSNDLKGPKSVSIFIAKLSQLCPRLVIKQMILLIRLLDNEVGNKHFRTPYPWLTSTSHIPSDVLS